VLPELGLPARASLLRLYCGVSPEPEGERPRPEAPASEAVHVEPQFFESMEGGSVRVAAGFAGLARQDQLVWTLAVIHEAVRQLVAIRGGDVSRLELARRHTESRGMRFEHEGPWKSSSRRTHKARAV
jgi:hypothetical protein